VVLIAGALLVALSACGDDDGGGNGLSLVEFERRAAAACERAMEAKAERFPPEAVGDPEPPPDVLREQAIVEADVVRGYRDDLARLDPPSGLRDEFEEMLKTLDELAAAYDDAAEAAGTGDVDAARRAYNRAGTLGARANRIFFDHARDAFCAAV